MSSQGHGLCPDRTSDVSVPMDTTYSKMHLINEKIRQGLKEANFIIPSPVQRKALPRTLCGFDTIFKAKSGTGKTAVFAITALQSIIDLESSQPQVLILAPTREIAVQIVDVIRSIGAFVSGLKVEWFIGGTYLQHDIEKLKNCRIVVGAPGRIAHLIELGHLSMNSIRLFVVDEADQMLQPSFAKEFNYIFNSLPESKQVLICSATFTFEIIKFLRKYMTTFSFVSGDKEDDTDEDKLSFASLVGMRPFISTVEEKYASSNIALFHKKMSRLQEILKTTTFSQCLIFTNYITRVKTISNTLRETGFVTALLSSEQTQTERLHALEQLKQGKCRVLVTTDLAARGIDVQNVDTVINFEVPINEQTYLHRMGRAGRYGSHGIVITIIAEGDEMMSLRSILGTIKASVTVLPSQSPFIDAADNLKVQELKLEEISGLNEEEQQLLSALPSSEKTVSNSFQNKNLSHSGKFLPDGNKTQFNDIKSIFSDCNLKENICPKMSNSGGVCESSNGELSVGNVPGSENIRSKKKNENYRKTDSSANSQNQLVASATKSANSNSNLVLKGSFLQRLYSVHWAKDVNLDQFKPSIEIDFERLRHKSVDFFAQLKPHLKVNNILFLDHENVPLETVTNENIEHYYYFCKFFKNMNQNLVRFIESTLNEQKSSVAPPKVLGEIDDVLKARSCGSANNTYTGVRIPANLIRRKPEYSKSVIQKSLDSSQKRPATKYLYLRQNMLKRLYNATKVNKDFCVENLRPGIEPSFSQLWKSNIMSAETIHLLNRLDILRQPTKALNSQTLDLYFQFCRHFRHINPDLVSSVSTKISRIEAGTTYEELKKHIPEQFESNEDSLQNTGRVPANILAFYYSSEHKEFNDVEIDETVKERTMSKVSVKTDFVSNLKNRIGPNLFVEPSFKGNYFMSYFKLCKIFKNVDADFISYIEQKVKDMPSKICANQANETVANLCPNINSTSEVSLDNSANSEQRSSINSNSSTPELLVQSNSNVIQPSASLENPPVESDSSFVSTEHNTTQSYKELSSYPPCESTPNSTTRNLNAELSSVLQNYHQSLMKTAENNEVRFKAENKDLVLAVFNVLKDVKKVNHKDVEAFCEKPKLINVRVGDSLPKLSKKSNTSPEVVHQEGDLGLPCEINKLATKTPIANYSQLLRSFQTSRFSSSVKNLAEPRDILHDKTKNDIRLFCDSVESQAHKHVSFSDCVRTADAVRLLYKDDESILKAVCSQPSDSHEAAKRNINVTAASEEHVGIDNSPPVEIGIANLNLQELKVVAGQTSKLNLKNFEPKSQKNYQNHVKSDERTKIQASSSGSQRDVRQSKKHLKISSKKEDENDSSDWVTASSAGSDTDEEDITVFKIQKNLPVSNSAVADFSGHQSSTMNLCDHCKNWYRPSSKTEVPDFLAKKLTKRAASKKHSKRSSPNDHVSRVNLDGRAPSYEQLIQWYNMWYQQVVFSEQFVWYNEYLRNMSSQD